MGHNSRIDMKGKKFNRLFIDKYSHTKGKVAYWNVKCDCGNTLVVAGGHIRNGHTKSCGCLRRELARLTTHGMSNAKLYGVWAAIKRRCNVGTDPHHITYTKKGITVCKEWQDANVFIQWALANGYKEGLTIERINNNGHYSPDNCKWATHKENCNNRDNTHHVTFHGNTQTLSEWAYDTEIKHSTLYARIFERGWTAEEALMIPANGGRLNALL